MVCKHGQALTEDRKCAKVALIDAHWEARKGLEHVGKLGHQVIHLHHVLYCYCACLLAC